MRLLTRDLPGTGGLHKASPEDFIVDELPAYAPAGDGAHTFVRIEKRALTTADAVARLCRALGVAPKDAGVVRGQFCVNDTYCTTVKGHGS